MNKNYKHMPVKQRADQLLIKYPDFDSAFKKAKIFIIGHQGLCAPGYFQLVGDSRVGKTRLLKALETAVIEFEEFKSPENNQKNSHPPRVIYSRAEAGEKTKALVHRILLDLQDVVGNGSVNAGVTSKISRQPFAYLARLLRQRFEYFNVKVLIIDEIHNLLDSSGQKATSQTIATFKQFLDDVGIPVIVAGTQASYSLTETSPELKGRRRGFHELTGLGEHYETRLTSMRNALGLIEKHLPEFNTSVFRNPDVLAEIEEVVQHRLGMFVEVIYNAALLSEPFDQVIDPHLLDTALDNYRDSHVRRFRQSNHRAA